MAGFFKIFVMFLYFLRVFIDLFSSDFYFQIYSDRFILVFNVLCSILGVYVIGSQNREPLQKLIHSYVMKI